MSMPLFFPESLNLYSKPSLPFVTFPCPSYLPLWMHYNIITLQFLRLQRQLVIHSSHFAIGIDCLLLCILKESFTLCVTTQPHTQVNRTEHKLTCTSTIYTVTVTCDTVQSIKLCMCVWVCVCMCACVCVRVCVCACVYALRINVCYSVFPSGTEEKIKLISVKLLL